MNKKTLALQYKVKNWTRPVSDFIADMYWMIVNSKLVLFIVTAIIFTSYPFAYLQYGEVQKLVDTKQEVELIEVVRTMSIEDHIKHIAEQEEFYEADLLIRIVKCESRFNPLAKNTTSTATGWYQFLEGTWTEGSNKMGVDWSLDDRTDLEKSTKMAIYWIKQGKLSKWDASRSCWN